MKTSIQIPIRTVSELNASEHWTQKHKRHKKQKKLVALYLKTFFKEKISLPVTISLTRIAPRSLDAHDNLRSAMKWIADSIAEFIFPNQASGRADDSDLLKWEYYQERGLAKQYAVRIDIIEAE